MAGRKRDFDWIAPVATALGLVAFVVMFLEENSAFGRQTLERAGYDVSARAALAAASLREPLETGNMPRIFEFGEQCRDDGMRLLVRGERGGTIYDSQPGVWGDDSLSAEFAVSGHSVSLSVPRARVLAPLRRARAGFLLAALAGASGMLLFFFVSYRQRVRIRELARIEKMRREFVADVSHEIKTPLTGIIGAVDLLADSEPPGSPRARLLDMAKKESERLNALAQGIMDLSRMEIAGQSASMELADLAEIADEAVERLRPQAEAAGVALKVDVPDGAVQIRCDAQLVLQAVTNLLANAVRHSGSPDVAVTVARTRGGAEIAVEDHGCGIPPEHAERVFERFHRVDPSRAADTGGAGLGLAIVRGIARLHGGDVRLERSAPSGCRFVVSLPSASK